jgi:outer membrane protein TolC
MKTKTTFTLLISLLFVTDSLKAVGRQDTLSIAEVVKLAIRNNRTIQIAALEKQKAVFQEKESRSKLLPHIEGYSTFSYYYAIPKMIVPGEIFGQTGNIPVEFGTKYDWNSGFKINQLIYNQSYLTSLKLVSEIIELQKLNLELQKDEVAFQVSRLYYLCLSVRNQLAAFDSTLANLEKLKDIVILQKKNDIARQVDVNRVAIDIRNLEIEKTRLEEHLNQQKNLLKILAGLPSDLQIFLADDIPNFEEKTTFSETQENRRLELQLLDKQVKTAELQLKMEKQNYLPALSAFGQHYYQGMRDQFDFFDGGEDRFFKSGIVGLQLSVPIFDGFSRQNRIKMKQVELQQIHYQREQTQLMHDAEFQEAWLNYENCQEVLRKQARNVGAAKENYKTNLLAYQEQLIDLTDLLISENQFTESRLQYLNARFELKNAELRLKKINGEILEKQK